MTEERRRLDRSAPASPGFAYDFNQPVPRYFVTAGTTIRWVGSAQEARHVATLHNALNGHLARARDLREDALN